MAVFTLAVRPASPAYSPTVSFFAGSDEQAAKPPMAATAMAAAMALRAFICCLQLEKVEQRQKIEQQRSAANRVPGALSALQGSSYTAAGWATRATVARSAR